MTNLVIMKNQQAITTSLQVAETFEKEHKNVLRDIENLKKDVLNFEPMFSEGVEPDSYGRERKAYFMNRDGFTLLAMGFTGSKALQFKLKYIEAFNEMENHIKQQLDTSNLSPELQMFQGIFQAVAKQELATKKLESKIDNISEIVGVNSTNWREDSNRLINKIVRLQGNTGQAHQEVRSTVFLEVDKRAGVSLQTRLTNKRRRMADEGVSKSRRDKLTKVDVIADDKKLIEIYVAVVKEYAIKYNVWNNDF